MLENTQVKFATVRELSKLYPSFSESSIRYWLFHAEDNGLFRCVRKIGKKVLINISEFEAWLDSQNCVSSKN